ncbi:DUF4381 domain-containing protein [Shewanella sp. 202IG2-18]|uniref:DUF4381 domain-containing protein n=1 Tax=Parashewanella hymeniacidonis TaxID=2807618 RepID=UPI0019614A0F|nr:DUF4381 domain-containing protein [Parashewanella hymeniacidonis]MBM7073098.1 DUF4381 domain-containing protein [Parashewanella hymeniacidonis]
MNASNPALAQLKDIQTPDAIGVWPLAIGYWVALVIAILAIVGLIYFYKKNKQQSLVKKAALSELNQIEIQNTQEFAVQINAILKRAALSYLKREQVAAIDGENWYQFLDSTLTESKKGQFKALLNQRYSKQGLSNEQKQQLKTLAILWIKKSLPLHTKSKSVLLLSKASLSQEAKC